MFFFVQLLLALMLASYSTLEAQHPYLGTQVGDCTNSNETGAEPSFLYTCDAPKPSCTAFLMFKTKPLYLTLSAISNLTSSDLMELARVNAVKNSSARLPPDSEVIVPVTCSCENGNYQANTTYVAQSDDIYYTIANDVYESLTDCDELVRRNTYGASSLYEELVLQVALKCACPTQKQIANGTKFLLTYMIAAEDTIHSISENFNVSSESVAVANGFSSDDENPLIYDSTPILIPLTEEPFMRKTFKNKKNKSYRGVYIGVGIGAVLSFLCFSLLLYCRRRRETEVSWRQKLPEDFMDKVMEIGETLKIYRFEELKEATDNFSPSKRLGTSIWIGNLRGEKLVIKRMSTDVSKEIKILGHVNHFNVIRLHGFCEHNGVFYLVYEHMQEGSLNTWLKNDCVSLTWSHRVLIALDVANGLNYLHNFTTPACVHKNINSCNILLNGDLRAKIANFSLARENGNSDTAVKGMRGYVAPECMREGCFTPKVDVYAFGVVLSELVTGREAVFVRSGKEVLLAEAVVCGVNGGVEINDLVDPHLQVKNPLGYVIDHTEIALRLLKLSVACLARESESRLSMAEVVSALIKIQSDIC